MRLLTVRYFVRLVTVRLLTVRYFFTSSHHGIAHCCFVLSSMEECDALCTRLVIMVNGQFVCLGSPQHLKNKFGSGYTLIVRLSADDSNPTAIKNFIKERFADSQIFDDHHGYVHFQIPDTTVSLSTVFGAMEEASSSLGLEDYSVHQTTLEQVFLTFTTNQVCF